MTVQIPCLSHTYILYPTAKFNPETALTFQWTKSSSTTPTAHRCQQTRAPIVTVNFFLKVIVIVIVTVDSICD